MPLKRNPLPSSLDILQPHRLDRHPSSPARHPDADRLESLSAGLLDLLNTKDHRTAPIMAHVAETCLLEFEGQVVATTRAGHIAVMEAVTRAHPMLRVEVTGTASVFQGYHGGSAGGGKVRGKGVSNYATVWVFMRATNYPHLWLWKEVVKFFAWERRGDEGWVCVKHVGFRGALPLDGAWYGSGGVTLPAPVPAAIPDVAELGVAVSADEARAAAAPADVLASGGYDEGLW